MRDKLIIVGGIALVFLVVMFVVVGHKDRATDSFALLSSGGEGSTIAVQVVGGESVQQAASAGSLAGTSVRSHFPAISQRDKSQYASEQEWQTWAASACSAAALSSVLNGYGKQVRITDVLSFMQQQDAIKAGAGLYRYDVIGTLAARYNLRAVYSEDKNLDAHFDQVLGYLKQGYPVILNVLDSTFFPNGHFIVATGINQDGSIAILNPDPTGDKSVNQNWPVEGLKLYFSRMERSAAILPA